MTRVIDKRNVFILAKANETTKATVYLYKRGSDLAYRAFDGFFDDKIDVDADEFNATVHLTTPDMLLVIDPSRSPATANAKVFFNGVEVPADEVNFAGDPYKVWGLKSQDFVFLDFSGVTA